jgi:hypothetical protein
MKGEQTGTGTKKSNKHNPVVVVDPEMRVAKKPKPVARPPDRLPIYGKRI